MKKSRLVLFALLLAAIVVYLFAGGQHREDLGELELYPKDSTKLYCAYKITSADPDDTNAFPVDTKICIVCEDGWPGGAKDICYSRIEYISASGYYTYEAELHDKLLKQCHECLDARAYYKTK